MASRHPRLDELIASTPGWKGVVVERLREAIHAADPEIEETWKWVSPNRPGTPCFEHGGILCHVNVLKERVRLTMSDGALLPDPQHLFNANLDSGRRRAIDWSAGDPFDAAAVEAIVRAGVAHRLAAKSGSR
jgi:hypothetical protein